jgi:hypothetical protein
MGVNRRLFRDNFTRKLIRLPAYFTVESKDGIVMEFGNTADSKYFTDDNSKVYIWRLNRIFIGW